VRDRAPEAVVLVDETYRESTYDDDPTPWSAAAMSPQIVTCSSRSKAHGAPGLRIGWLTTTAPELYERRRQAKFHTTIACSTVRLRLPTNLFPDDTIATFYARLAKSDTRVAPGSWFGEHDRVFRLGFGPPSGRRLQHRTRPPRRRPHAVNPEMTDASQAHR
jgi:DNA-binding transcriptional MocR family regulator